MQLTPSSRVRQLDAISACLLLLACAYFAYRTVAMGHARRAGAPAYSSGDRLAEMPDLGLGQAKATFIVVLSPSCPYCERSLSHYRELAAVAHASRGALRLVFVALADRPSVQRQLQAAAVADAVLVDRPAGLRVTSVPTVLLAGPDGYVRRVWTGLLSDALRKELLDVARGVGSS